MKFNVGQQVICKDKGGNAGFENGKVYTVKEYKNDWPGENPLMYVRENPNVGVYDWRFESYFEQKNNDIKLGDTIELTIDHWILEKGTTGKVVTLKTTLDDGKVIESVGFVTKKGSYYEVKVGSVKLYVEAFTLDFASTSGMAFKRRGSKDWIKSRSEFYQAFPGFDSDDWEVAADIKFDFEDVELTDDDLKCEDDKV